MLDEERAFWGLVGIVERHMGYEYYTDPLIVARADLSIFKVHRAGLVGVWGFSQNRMYLPSTQRLHLR